MRKSTTTGGGRPISSPPRWPAALALVAVGVLYSSVSNGLTVGPNLFLLGLILVLLVPVLSAHRAGKHRLARMVAFGLLALVTSAVAASVVLLVALPQGRGAPAPALLGDAALIWVSNTVGFAVWYWEVDGGGPAGRRAGGHEDGDFLFPQTAAGGASFRGWSPGFVDYLFLAFNTSTAFSPTDTAVLSRRAKVLCMVQSSLSLVTVAVLLARAVGAL